MFLSVFGAYRLELPAGWRRSACFGGFGPSLPSYEGFTNVAPADEVIADVGGLIADHVDVQIMDNSAGQTAMQWLRDGHLGGGVGYTFAEATVDGKPGARVAASGDVYDLAYVVAARGRIYAVIRTMRTTANDAVTRALMDSFHILSDAELAAARAAAPSPTPLVVRTPDEIAAAIRQGFAQKDTNILATVAAQCLTRGVEQGGASTGSIESVLEYLRSRFANGLTVALLGPIEYGDPTLPVVQAWIRGTWSEPGQPTISVRQMLTKRDSTWYWTGYLIGPPVP